VEQSNRNSHAEQTWGKRALAYAVEITEKFFGRGSATPIEIRTAEFIRSRLLEAGITDVEMQPFEGARSIWLFFAFAFGIALSGHLAFWVFRVPFGSALAGVIALPFFLLSAWLLYQKFTFRTTFADKLLPRGSSRNVIARIAPVQAAKKRVVLVGHMDTHRVVWWFSGDFLLKIYALVSPLAVYGVFFSPVFYLCSAFSGISVFAWLGLGAAVFHLLAWFSGLLADMSIYSPGANDNASAVGTLLAAGERLSKDPLATTEVWLAFTGCEETGCDGMRRLLDEYGTDLRDAFFLDFELVGIGGQLRYLRREGVIRRNRIDADVEAIVREAGSLFGVSAVGSAGTGAFTEMGVVWERGLKGVCMVTLRDGSPIPPEWHRISDVPARLEAGAFQRVHAFTWALLQTLDGKSNGE